MDLDERDITAGSDKGDFDDALTKKQQKVKKVRNVSDDSDSDDSDDDYDAYMEDHTSNEQLVDLSCDGLDEDEPADILPEWEDHVELMRYHKALTQCKLMQTVQHERLVLDPGAGFYVIDGDSLIIEVMGTKSWKYGQQLHLFYLVEIYLYQLRENGGGAFEIVFFKDMERIWYRDILCRLFREAVINHLLINCGIKVHREWKDPFDPLWEEYLCVENPSFIFVHDGCSQSPTVDIILKILSYQCLAQNIDIAFTSDVKKQASKLHAVFVKSKFGHAHEKNKTFVRSAWSCLVKFLDNKYIDVPKIEEPMEGNNFKDNLFIKSLECYWNELSEEERKTDDVKRTANRWCRYFSFLSCGSLSERIAVARTTDHDFKDNLAVNSRLYMFVYCILRCLRDSSNLLSSCEDSESIADIIDLSLYQQLFESVTTSAIISSSRYESKYIVLHDLAKSRGIEFETDVVNFSSIEPTTHDVQIEKESALIAIDSHLADEFAGEVKRDLNVTDSAILDEDGDDSDDVLEDIYNWRSGETLKDDVDHFAQKALSKKPFIRKKQLKEIQKFNDFIATYGRTMEKTIEPTLITKTENKENKENKKAEKVHQKQKSKKQGNKKNMKETIIEENKKKILDENKKRVATQWKTKKAEIEDSDVALAIRKTSDFIRKSDSSKLGFEDPLILLLQLQYDRWKQSCSDDNNGNISYAADLVQTLHGLLQSENASDSMKIKVAKYFLRLGFKDVASNVTKMLPESKQGSLKISDKCPVDLPYNVFQMKFMGHLLKRQERSDPDPRVTGFIPDTWQRELLDVVDKNESAVIVAPTSSGKTFCSFYCMEKVLRESDTNVVVYVSPTKALVNQVQASIYSRYNKNMPAGMSVVGCFTRDYQHNALTSQILVTVPQCLEILLLSPKRQQWASKISYVIFDEVHCIGAETGGEVWEHLITLIRCPFLALSATVGNPEFFHSWLRCVNRFKEMQNDQTGKGKSNMKYNVKLVVHNERYSDISKNIYFPQSDEIVETNPCIFLDAHSLSGVGFPSAFSLSPKEAHELWEAGLDSFKDDTDESNILQKWNPESYFGEKLFITKQMAREYEVSLKKQLEGLLKGDLSKAQLLLDYFRKGIAGNVVADSSDEGCEIYGVSEKEFNIYKTFPAMIEKLKSEDKLPVIVFMNDRQGIEKLAKILSAYVAKKISDVQTKMSDVYAKEAEADERAKKSGKTKKNVDSDGEEIENHMQEYLQGLKNKQTLIIQKKENACKFISPGTLSAEDREKIILRVKERTMLEFGICYHHSGCKIKHKRAVEILFRSKFAQVVLATATLALGIHMPCKSVVFVGDDHYVDALNYRQMSGRSGRRGFDNLGNVIFYGVPLPKISKLIKADISKLDGQFPVSCTIILRLLLLVMGAADIDDAHKKAMTVLSHPFVAHQAPALQTQLRHYFLFVTDFLIRQALIDEKGVPLGFSGLVSHLHYHEPGNLVFVSLLRKGIFHSICKPSKVSQPISFGKTCQKCSISPIPGNRYTCTLCPFDYDLCSKCFSAHKFHKFKKDEHRRTDFEEIEANLKFMYSEETLRSLVSILSHVFCVKEVPSIRLKIGSGNSFELKGKPKTSKVILESMTDDVYQAVSAYNDSVQSIFGNYLCVVSNTVPRDSHAKLPLSQKCWKLNTEEVHDNASSVEHFVQLSGCSNIDVKTYCLDTEEIRRIIPRQIYMNFNFIPALSLGKPKNAYALDFFKHGSRKALEFDNWISISEVYASLNDFRLLINTISIALEQLGPDDLDDHVVWAFKHLRFEYGERFHGAFPGVRIKQEF